jgi:antitoxin (DNA-binding transcriptional repressor) of toxin-antitoxin stability system
MNPINIAEASQKLSDLIDAALRGEDVSIMKDELSIVKLIPATSVKRRPQFGSAKGLITMSDDFDEPLEDFKEYMG